MRISRYSLSATNNYLIDVGNLGLGEEPRIVVQYLSARNIQVGRTPAMSSFVALALFFAMAFDEWRCKVEAPSFDLDKGHSQSARVLQPFVELYPMQFLTNDFLLSFAAGRSRRCGWRRARITPESCTPSRWLTRRRSRGRRTRSRTRSRFSEGKKRTRKKERKKEKGPFRPSQESVA